MQKFNKTHGKLKFMLQQIIHGLMESLCEYRLNFSRQFLVKSTMIRAKNANKYEKLDEYDEIVTFIRYSITVSSINTLFASLKFESVDDIRNNRIIMICFTVDGYMAHDFKSSSASFF